MIKMITLNNNPETGFIVLETWLKLWNPEPGELLGMHSKGWSAEEEHRAAL